MKCKRVELSVDSYQACVAHAWSTQAEEIMGLLVGSMKEEAGGKVVQIFHILPQKRTDRRDDRVETSPESLAMASSQAEEYGGSVVGWYHSHPHKIVDPSSVDLRTQLQYQMMDSGFVGIIVSVFNTDSATCNNPVQMIAFQSKQVQHSRLGYQADTIVLDGEQDMAGDTAEIPFVSSVPGGVADLIAVFAPISIYQPPTQYPCLRAVLECMLEEERLERKRKLDNESKSGDSASYLGRVHHDSIYNANIAALMEVAIVPAINAKENLREGMQTRNLRCHSSSSHRTSVASND